ncbi:MAG: hypothetical protein R6V12_07810, partial [Candidatus Hydrogenedentota bacterium]
KEIPGWNTPGNRTVTITLDTTREIEAAYSEIAHTGELCVFIEPQGAIDAGAMWRRVESAVTKSEAEITSGDVLGIDDAVFSGGVLEVPLLLFGGDNAISEDAVSERKGGGAPAEFSFEVVYDPERLSFTTVAVSEASNTSYGYEVTASEPDGPNSGRIRMTFAAPENKSHVLTAGNLWKDRNADQAFPLATMYFRCGLGVDASTALFVENLVATDGELSLDAGKGRSAVVKLDGDSGWLPSGATESGIDPGTYTVEFKEVDGWIAPTAKKIDIVAGDTTILTGGYKEEVASTGSLEVIIEPGEAVNAGAQWRVDHREWEESGVTILGLSVGSYRVSFRTISGWTEPDALDITIEADETKEVLVEYTRKTSSLQVTIRPQDAVDAGAQWRVDDGAWQASGASVTGLSAGSYTVSFKAISGWDEPGAKDVTVEAGLTAEVSGTYTYTCTAQTGDQGGCPLFNNKTLQPFAEVSVYEPVMPVAVDKDGLRLCAPVAPLAIRLRSDEAIDPGTVWGVVSWSEAASEAVTWLPLDDGDGWAIYQPEEPWTDGEAISFTAGAYTVSGQEVGPFTYEFVASGDVYEGSAAVVESSSTTVNPEFVGIAYEIDPGTVYFEPLTVQLPVPDDVHATALEPAYLYTEDGESRWVDGKHVEGWLEPDSVRVIQDADGTFIEFKINHGGAVQLRRRVVSVSSAGMNNESVTSDLLLFIALCGLLLFQKCLRGQRL